MTLAAEYSGTTDSPEIINRPGIIARALALAITGSMALVMLPIMTGALSDQFGFTPDQVGWIASADLAGMAISSAMAVFWVRSIRWNRAFMMAGAIFLIGNLLSALSSDITFLVPVRFLAGLGGGALMAVALACLSDTRSPERQFGLMMVGQGLVAALVLWQLPLFVSHFGARGVFVLLTGLAVLAISLGYKFPAGGKDYSTTPSTDIGIFLPTILALAAVFIYFIAQGGVWAFAERLGAISGIPANAIGQWLGLAQITGIMGSLTVTFIGIRFGRLWPLTLCLLLQIVSLGLLAGATDVVLYGIGLLIFSYCWSMSAPLLMGALAHVDRTGRAIVLFITMVKGGLATGPILAGYLISAQGYQAMCILAGFLCFIVLIMLLPLVRNRGGTEKASAPGVPAE